MFTDSSPVIPTKRKELKINRFQLLFSYPEICGEKRKKTCGIARADQQLQAADECHRRGTAAVRLE